MEARIIRRSLVTIAVGLAMGSAGVAHATNGYFAHGYGTKAKGMGGVGMAISQDSYAPAINPAGIAGMETRIDGSLAYFRPERSVTFEGAPTVDSDSKNFFIPSIGYVQQIDENRSWGIALMGNGGLNTDYPAITNMCPDGQGGMEPTPNAGLFCGGTAGVNLEQLAIIPTYAQKFADGRVSVGFSPIISYQRFEAKGIGAFAFDDQGNPVSVSPEHVSDNGTDTTWGYGAQIGFQAEVADGVTLGGSYRSKIRNGDFDDYRGLFAGGGSFDIPSTYGLGVSAEVTPAVTLSADYVRINYSDVDAISNPSTNQAPLGSAGGPGFGWRDINIIKLGAQFETGNDWTWRVGYNRGQNPIRSRDVTFNILAPGVMEDHFTAGFTKSFGSQHELSFAAMYAPSKSVTGPTPFGADATIEMKQYELEIGYAYRF
ncbi:MULTISPECIES: OmpP1/FadL family transporter [unclassified Thioalkalivibrio]|uniref:OmpP1/FadL family transporter n=1 Tax=unclassified Thioalkalivibrio TaxID=2621013 RepID=UPI00035E9E6A|nr:MULTISPECIES: outer membrane protein transport protein [unclassified Thioalkalivibrio]